MRHVGLNQKLTRLLFLCGMTVSALVLLFQSMGILQFIQLSDPLKPFGDLSTLALWSALGLLGLGFSVIAMRALKRRAWRRNSHVQPYAYENPDQSEDNWMFI